MKVKEVVKKFSVVVMSAAILVSSLNICKGADKTLHLLLSVPDRQIRQHISNISELNLDIVIVS